MHNRGSMSRLPSRACQAGFYPALGHSPRAFSRPGGSAAQQSGFTLMEIIVVVILIGGIVAFAASRILGNADRAKANLARAQVQTVAEKIQQFEMDIGRLPSGLGELVTAPGDATGWLGPYAKETELKDPWNHQYQYAVPGQSGPFDLVSLGKDGQAGGDSVNADIAYQN